MRTLFAAVIAVFLAGCGTLSAPRYSILVDNNTALKSIPGARAHVAAVTLDTVYDDMCRGVGHIVPPDGLTIQQYVAKAINDELRMAGIYDAERGVALVGSITRIAFWQDPNNALRGSWVVGLSLRGPGAASVSTEASHDFDVVFSGDSACEKTAHELVPVMQSAINYLVTDPRFAAMVR